MELNEIQIVIDRLSNITLNK